MRLNPIEDTLSGMMHNIYIILDSELFEETFESMVQAAYCNRNGISTIKEDDTPYRVDQRNIFCLQQSGVRSGTTIIDKRILHTWLLRTI